eukprot:3087287-Pleurochrysis_carterae.AAC.1
MTRSRCISRRRRLFRPLKDGNASTDNAHRGEPYRRYTCVTASLPVTLTQSPYSPPSLHVAAPSQSRAQFPSLNSP